MSKISIGCSAKSVPSAAFPDAVSLWMTAPRSRSDPASGAYPYQPIFEEPFSSHALLEETPLLCKDLLKKLPKNLTTYRLFYILTSVFSSIFHRNPERKLFKNFLNKSFISFFRTIRYIFSLIFYFFSINFE